MSSGHQLPFLPGYNQTVKPKTQFHKSHLFDVQNGIRVDTTKASDLVDERSFAVNSTQNLQLTQPTNDFANSYGAKYNTANAPLNSTSSLPAWVAYDRKVLRFYAFFKEAVFSSQVENARLRKCVLYYYLEDDSVHIAEPKIENSGIPQGVFVKRHRIPNSNGNFLSVNDLRIGADLHLYGRNFHLYDCDDFTRAHFAEIGAPQPEPDMLPNDQFTMKHTVEPGTHKKQMHPMKEWMEASLGKQMGVEISATQKFLKNDGNVLRFYCVWDDQKLLGEKRPYILHYFLADDTVEVMEVKQANSGRDAFPALYKRAKLPKRYTDIAPDMSNIGSNLVKASTEFYTERDIRVGHYVNVYGRELSVLGADEFTKNFYVTNYGMNPADLQGVSFDVPAEAPPTIYPPPYNGFGTEEDSLNSFLYLMPKVPKSDFKKLMENDGLVLRFLGQFTSPAPEDKLRRFIISYYMNNDTISIFEKFVRNSGFIGGKFLERGRIKNPATGEYYTTKDLFIGQNIILNNFQFDIIDCDDFTKTFIQMNPTHFAPQAQQALSGAGNEPPLEHPEVAF